MCYYFFYVLEKISVNWKSWLDSFDLTPTPACARLASTNNSANFTKLAKLTEMT